MVILPIDVVVVIVGLSPLARKTAAAAVVVARR